MKSPGQLVGNRVGDGSPAMERREKRSSLDRDPAHEDRERQLGQRRLVRDFRGAGGSAGATQTPGQNFFVEGRDSGEIPFPRQEGACGCSRFPPQRPPRSIAA